MPDDPTDDIEIGVSLVDLPADWLEELHEFKRKRRRFQILERERAKFLESVKKGDDGGE